MKRFLKENILWLILAVIAIIAILTNVYLSDENWFRKIINLSFSIVGAFTIFVGIGTIIHYIDNKNLFKYTWQVALILLILVLSIIELTTLIK